MNILQQLFQPQPTASDTSDGTLSGWLSHLLPLLTLVPRAGLSTRERSSLQGYAFLEAGLICFLFERALQKDPAAFPEIPGEGDRLRALGRRAALWLSLRELLRELTRRADDQFELARAERVGITLQHLKDYRAQDQIAWAQGPLQQRRRALLLAAEWTVDAWQRRIQGKRRKPTHP